MDKAIDSGAVGHLPGAIVRNVTPLDHQLGAWPAKTVPDLLQDDVFGQRWGTAMR